MPVNHVVVANPSADRMTVKSEFLARIYLLDSSISVLKGEGHINHLNNILSTDISHITKGQRVNGLICDSNGRVSDVISCFELDNETLLLGISRNSIQTRDILTRGIPWNKELVLMDGDHALRHLKISGVDSEEMLNKIHPDIPPLAENKFCSIDDKIFSKSVHNGNIVIDIIVRSDDNSFNDMASVLGIDILDTQDWEVPRIRMGYPSHNEANSKLLPSDIGMGELVSLNKGCYPGQEIHARLDSRGSAKRRMSLIRSDSAILKGKHKVLDGSTINVTSSVETEDGCFAIAIAPIDLSQNITIDIAGSKSELYFYDNGF